MTDRRRWSGSRWSARSRGAARTNDLEARRVGGKMTCRRGGTPGSRGQRGGDRPGGQGAGLTSLSPPRGEDQVGSEGLRSGGASQGRAVYAARAVVVAPAGAKGLLAVSMCRIASVSLRAMSTRGDRGSALAAQPDLGALVAV